MRGKLNSVRCSQSPNREPISHEYVCVLVHSYTVMESFTILFYIVNGVTQAQELIRTQSMSLSFSHICIRLQVTCAIFKTKRSTTPNNWFVNLIRCPAHKSTETNQTKGIKIAFYKVAFSESDVELSNKALTFATIERTCIFCIKRNVNDAFLEFQSLQESATRFSFYSTTSIRWWACALLRLDNRCLCGYGKIWKKTSNKTLETRPLLDLKSRSLLYTLMNLDSKTNLFLLATMVQTF